MKIVINSCHGGFTLSPFAQEKLGYNEHGFSRTGKKDISRNDPALVELIETFGTDKCSGSCSHLKVVEIPDDVVWAIEEYDGLEWVAEAHQTWG